MFLTEAAFGLCILCLGCVLAVQVRLFRRGNPREAQKLNWVKRGLVFSACAYLLHLQGGAPGSVYSVLGLVFRLAGLVFLSLAWGVYWQQRRDLGLARQAARERPEKDDGPEFGTALPPHYGALYSVLNSRAREVLCTAQEEALRARQARVDTDHLLRGLLQVPDTAASRLLERQGVSAAALEREEQSREPGEGPPGLTPRAGQVLAMAEIEAHRFGKTFVGTEHLLLGLLLIGTGPAASVLFQSGLSVDTLRRELAARK